MQGDVELPEVPDEQLPEIPEQEPGVYPVKHTHTHTAYVSKITQKEVLLLENNEYRVMWISMKPVLVILNVLNSCTQVFPQQLSHY